MDVFPLIVRDVTVTVAVGPAPMSFGAFGDLLGSSHAAATKSAPMTNAMRRILVLIAGTSACKDARDDSGGQ
jgi:hypothetical protein